MSLSSVVTTPAWIACDLGIIPWPVWAELPEEADAAGWLAGFSDDHHSNDRIERR